MRSFGCGTSGLLILIGLCAGGMGAFAQDAAPNWAEVERLLGAREAELAPSEIMRLAEARHKLGTPVAAIRTLRRGVERHANVKALRIALIDAALGSEQYSLALRETRAAMQRLGAEPRLRLYAATALHHLGESLGRAGVRQVPDGRAGEFAGDLLLLEKTDQPDSFLCCDRDSAMYQVRRALDGGLQSPAAFVLHAQLWTEMGRADTGWKILRNREAKLLDDPSDATLRAFAQVALAAGALEPYLRTTQRLARRSGDRREALLFDAYRVIAERYSRRGDGVMQRAFLRRALRIRNDDLGVLFELAEAQWDAGLRSKAQALYLQVFALSPMHPSRARILERLGDQAP